MRDPAGKEVIRVLGAPADALSGQVDVPVLGYWGAGEEGETDVGYAPDRCAGEHSPREFTREFLLFEKAEVLNEDGDLDERRAHCVANIRGPDMLVEGKQILRCGCNVFTLVCKTSEGASWN